MIYSVWNYGAKRYDYYRSNTLEGTHAGTPPVKATNALGAVPEDAAWPLPTDAVLVGSGEVAQGKIATTSSSLVLGDVASSVPKWALYGGIAYVAWRIFR